MQKIVENLPMTLGEKTFKNSKNDSEGKWKNRRETFKDSPEQSGK